MKASPPPASKKPYEEQVHELATKMNDREKDLKYDLFKPKNTFSEGPVAKQLEALRTSIQDDEKLDATLKAQLAAALDNVEKSAKDQYASWLNGEPFDPQEWQRGFESVRAVLVDKKRSDAKTALRDLQTKLTELETENKEQGQRAQQAVLAGQGLNAPAADIKHNQQIVDDCNAKAARLTALSNEIKTAAGGVNDDKVYAGLSVTEKENQMRDVFALLQRAHATAPVAALNAPSIAAENKVFDDLKNIEQKELKEEMKGLARSLKTQDENNLQAEIRHRMAIELYGAGYKAKLFRAYGDKDAKKTPAGMAGVQSLQGDIEALEEEAKLMKSASGPLRIGDTGTYIEYSGGKFYLPRYKPGDADYASKTDKIFNSIILMAQEKGEKNPKCTIDFDSPGQVNLDELRHLMQKAKEKGIQVELGPVTMKYLRDKGLLSSFEEELQKQHDSAKEVAEARYNKIMKDIDAERADSNLNRAIKRLEALAPAGARPEDKKAPEVAAAKGDVKDAKVGVRGDTTVIRDDSKARPAPEVRAAAAAGAGASEDRKAPAPASTAAASAAAAAPAARARAGTDGIPEAPPAPADDNKDVKVQARDAAAARDDTVAARPPVSPEHAKKAAKEIAGALIEYDAQIKRLEEMKRNNPDDPKVDELAANIAKLDAKIKDRLNDTGVLNKDSDPTADFKEELHKRGIDDLEAFRADRKSRFKRLTEEDTNPEEDAKRGMRPGQ